MTVIRAFKGIRPSPGFEEKVACKPYDVLNSNEARFEAEGNPYSFLRVIKSEITLPENIDPYSDEVYNQAKLNFKSLMNQKALFKEDKDCLYVYSQKMGDMVQTGLVALSSIDDYFENRIKKHEYTRPVKEKDRITHIKVTGIQSGPVFLTYPDVARVNEIVNEVKTREPNYDFAANDGVQHTLWVISDLSSIHDIVNEFQNNVPATYIADGHHRAASSAKVGLSIRDENTASNGDESYNYFLSVLFPKSEINIIDYNRVVTDLNGLSRDDFIAKLGDCFDVENHGKEIFKPNSKKSFGMYLDGEWHSLTAKEGFIHQEDLVKSLDVSILHDWILRDILDIQDVRTDNRVDFVGGIRGLEELEKRVDSGDMKAAFALYPVSIDELIRISDSGEVMPPKSTWFEPKLRSGLVIHQFSS